MIDPRARQRVETIPVRPTVVPTQTNAELLAAFARHIDGKVAEVTARQYVRAVEDATRFLRDGEAEIPVRKWTKQQVSGFLVYVEQNYCASFNVMPYRAGLVTCRQRVWIGGKPAEEAARDVCATCPRFKRVSLKGRLAALQRFYAYLARVGIVPYNFVTDLMKEYAEDNANADDGREKRRNPLVDEEARLVNGTAHPQRRFFYGLTAKNGPRPNEAFALDRFASFGLPMPEGVSVPLGFEHGFPEHPEALEKHPDADLYYIPEKYDPETGKKLKDKRKGNRWGVIDAELRPLRDAHFAWWDLHVKRDANGRPVTTSLWLNERGTALDQKEMYASLFYDDAERLDLMRPPSGDDPGDRADPMRRMTGHGQRHFLERVLQMHDVPSEWAHHFRGDAFRSARKHYFKPEPRVIREKYLQFMPRLGFKPVPDLPAIDGGPMGEREAHAALLRAELARVQAVRSENVSASSVEVVSAGAAVVVPRRIAASVLYAFRMDDLSVSWEARPLAGGVRKLMLPKRGLVEVLERAARALA